MKVSVVIPVYNEAENIIPLEQEVSKVLTNLQVPSEVIWVDDGSQDQSAKILEELHRQNSQNKVIIFRKNYGQTAAMDAGINLSKGEIIIPLDSDLQNDPSDIPRLIEKLNEGYDVVSGWRKNRKDNILRKIPSLVANWLIRKLTKVSVSDYGCTLKAYKAELIRDINLYGEMHRFIPALVFAQGGKITEIEVNHRPRTKGHSKYGFSRVPRVALDLLTVVFLGKFITKPLHFFGKGAFGLISISAIISAWLLFDKFQNGHFVHRNPMFIICILLLMGAMQFLTTGLISELIIRNYFESQGKKIYKTKRILGS